MGLRFGDEYRPPMISRGKLTASYVAAFGSRQANVLNWYTGGGYAVPGAIAVSCSMVDTPEWDGQGGNHAGVVTIRPRDRLPARRRANLARLPGGPHRPPDVSLVHRSRNSVKDPPTSLRPREARRRRISGVFRGGATKRGRRIVGAA